MKRASEESFPARKVKNLFFCFGVDESQEVGEEDLLMVGVGCAEVLVVPLCDISPGFGRRSG